MTLTAVRQMVSAKSADFTETRMFFLGLVQVFLTALAFGVVFGLVAAFRIATLEPRPESVLLSVLLAIIPAVVFGAGIPYLIQRREYFNQLNQSATARIIVTSATHITYIILFFDHPATSLLYAITYLLSRVAILSGIYGGSRIKSILS